MNTSLISPPPAWLDLKRSPDERAALARAAGGSRARGPVFDAGNSPADADVLYGAVNPSGRLPVTFPLDVSVDYGEGADVGHRGYAKHGVRPLFAFGHGLSYSKYRYDGLKVGGGKTLTVSFDVKNVGERAGADVPQICLVSAAGIPEFRLLGFSRVSLQRGEHQSVSMTVDSRLLGHSAVGDEDVHAAR